MKLKELRKRLSTQNIIIRHFNKNYVMSSDTPNTFDDYEIESLFLWENMLGIEVE